MRARVFLAFVVVALFAIAPLTEAQTFTTLYNFIGPSTDGAAPYGGLTRDPEGNLNGTTELGGNCPQYPGCGTVFKIDQFGIETVIHNFVGVPDGSAPIGAVVTDTAGNVYGTTLSGGTATCGCGTVFKIDPAGNETILHSFAGGMDGEAPYAGVTLDAAGNIFGTTFSGGALNYGTVYKIDRNGTETIVYNFAGGNDAGLPYGGVTLDSAGNIYGTTQYGGSSRCYKHQGCGTVFKITPGGQETILYRFNALIGDGYYPLSRVVRDGKGNLYGTTSIGGAGGPSSGGTIFKVSPNGKETILHSFTGSPDGFAPYGGLVRDSAGNLYGTTNAGGGTGCLAIGCGTVFKLDAQANETILYNFAGGSDGQDPFAGVIRDAAGNLYGTTLEGGDLNCESGSGCGGVFKISPSSSEK